jgi:hypothetical protein
LAALKTCGQLAFQNKLKQNKKKKKGKEKKKVDLVV